MKKIVILLLLIGIQSFFYYSSPGLTMEALPERAMLYQDTTDGLGAPVTKNVYTKLLSEKTALDKEILIYLGGTYPPNPQKEPFIPVHSTGYSGKIA